MIAPVGTIDALLAKHGEDVRVTAIPFADRVVPHLEACALFDELRARRPARPFRSARPAT